MLKAHFSEAYVVDFGARGRDRSNSYDVLEFFDWKGLLIEVNPLLDYTIVQCAVSDRTGNATLTIGINDDVSSIIEASYDFRTESLDELPFSAKVKEAYVIVGQTSPNFILRFFMSDAPFGLHQP